MEKDVLCTEWPARAKPAHSVISPRKFAPETYSNKPPMDEDQIIKKGLQLIGSLHLIELDTYKEVPVVLTLYILLIMGPLFLSGSVSRSPVFVSVCVHIQSRLMCL